MSAINNKPPAMTPYANMQPTDLYQPPGLPPVSMEPGDIGVPLSDRVARDNAATEQTGVGQRPDFYEDPEQALGMLKYHLAEAQKAGNHNAVAYFQGEINKMMAAHDAQTQRLLQTYGVK